MEVRIRRDEETIQLESSKDNTSNGSSALLHRPLPSSLSFNATANDWRARLLTAELPCTIPLPLCERWRLACVCLIATPTVPLLLPLNQSKLLSFQLWFARLHANPKATPMASPAV